MADKKSRIKKIKQVVLVPHNPAWYEYYEAEAKRLVAVFEAEIISIHHAGSTSIRGIKAKPILDFLIIVRDIHRIDEYDEQMIAIGYDANGEHGIPGRRFFTRTEDDIRVLNIHVFEVGHPEIERMLNFRDYLRAHPLEAEAYSHLKETLASQFPMDIDRYTEGKSEFINEIISKAREWREKEQVD